ncbi:MAG: AAA family ATPase [Victivallales bacterium]|nr:AAA family ATPase [Victivallales bacterium]
MSVDGAYSENDDMKRFNTTGTCFPEDHYMVDLTERIREIRKMVDQGDYFCINRGRQYGKTTTLNALKNALQDDYTVFSISFESIGDETFEKEELLARAFLNRLNESIEFGLVSNASKKLISLLSECLAQSSEGFSLNNLRKNIVNLCRANEKPIVILIDEVDQAGNYVSFLKFLGILRDMYLNRRILPTFHSVILAGVYDIKNLKLKIRGESEHQYNSPWNIAAKFDVVMELTEDGIAGMLEDYENDHHTGMDVAVGAAPSA